MKRLATAAILTVSMSVSAFAADPADGLFAQAKEAFAARGDLAQNDKAIELLTQAVQVVKTDELKYDILILQSRAYYWKAGHIKKDADSMAVYEQGYNAAAAAKELFDEYAEGYYFYGINLGKWALRKGVVASLGRKAELIANAEGAMERETRDGKSGETIDGYGPHRTLGRMYFKLPGFAGGSREKSLQHLELAVKNAPNLALNTVYLAETLYDGATVDKNRARQLLDALIARDPKTLDPNRVPETTEEIAEGAQLRKEMGR